MKAIMIFHVSFFVACQLSAQCNFDQLIKEGRTAARREDFELALNKFNSARRCDPAKGDAVDREVDVVFKAIKKQRDEAKEQRKIAQAARDSLALLFEKIEAVSVSIVDALTREANQNILKMNYPAAADKLRTAAAFNKPTAAFIQAVQEVAFFWTESGKQTQAADLLRNTRQGAVPETRDALRNHLKKMDASQYAELEKRYFGDMVPIKGGTFKFGRDMEILEEGTDVEVSDFYIAPTETTFWQYGLFCAAVGRAISEKAEPAWGYEGHDPIIRVSWYDAVEYANWLSVYRGLKPAYTIDSLQQDTSNGNKFDDEKWMVQLVQGANGYRLPYEVEWEYAARGGKGQSYAGTDDADRFGDYAWYNKNCSRTQPVAGKKPNGYGLYDMSGNVWERCWDWYDFFSEKPGKNYSGPDAGLQRVLRGGSWDCNPEYCSTSYRDKFDPSSRYFNFGFRLVFVP